MSHTCHATGCKRVVSPKMFMCLTHWRMVPGFLQREVWAAYIPGQEIRKDPTPEYLDVARRVIEFVATREER